MFIIEQCNGEASEGYIDAFEASWRESWWEFSINLYANFWIGH